MADYLEELRSVYDLIVIDAPPMLACADARVLSRWGDTTVLIGPFREDTTGGRQAVREAVGVRRRSYGGRVVVDSRSEKILDLLTMAIPEPTPVASPSTYYGA